MEEEKKKAEAIVDPVAKRNAVNSLDAKRLIIDFTSKPSGLTQVKTYQDLSKKEVKKQVIQKIEKELEKRSDLFAQDVVKEAEAIYEAVVEGYQKNIIEIPRMSLVPDEVTAFFKDFDLDTSTGFDQQALQEEIMRLGLMDNSVDFIQVKQGAFSRETPVNQVVTALMDFPEVNYDDNAELLHKLATQAIDAISSKLDDPSEIRTVVRQFRRVIASNIYPQMMAHFEVSEPKYSPPNVLPFVQIEDWNFTLTDRYGYEDYRVKVPAGSVSKYVFRGFEKACHREYKFESTTEKDFAVVLENDKQVLKWLRPAPRQFRIYWDRTSKQYLPDFVVETADAIYLVETKKAKEIGTEEVESKKRAALEYCTQATAYTAENGGKPWKYLLIPHDEVQVHSTLEYLVTRYRQ
jgi:type III restriction enzyme